MKILSTAILCSTLFFSAVPGTLAAAGAGAGREISRLEAPVMEDLSYQEPTVGSQEQRPGFFATVIRVLVSLLVVFGCIMGAAYGFKKYNLARAGGNVAAGQSPMAALTGSVYLGPRKQVCIVDVMGRTLVLGVTENSISLLSEINRQPSAQPVPETVYEPEPAAPAPKTRPQKKQQAGRRPPVVRMPDAPVAPALRPDSVFMSQYAKIAEKFK